MKKDKDSDAEEEQQQQQPKSPKKDGKRKQAKEAEVQPLLEEQDGVEEANYNAERKG